jgi:hypothetical protein
MDLRAGVGGGGGIYLLKGKQDHGHSPKTQADLKMSKMQAKLCYFRLHSHKKALSYVCGAGCGRQNMALWGVRSG